MNTQSITLILKNLNDRPRVFLQLRFLPIAQRQPFQLLRWDQQQSLLPGGVIDVYADRVGFRWLGLANTGAARALRAGGPPPLLLAGCCWCRLLVRAASALRRGKSWRGRKTDRSRGRHKT